MLFYLDVPHINTLREYYICNAWSMMDLFLCSVKLSLTIIVHKAKVPKVFRKAKARRFMETFMLAYLSIITIISQAISFSVRPMDGVV